MNEMKAIVHTEHGSSEVLKLKELEKGNLVPKYAKALLIIGVAPSALAAIVTDLLSKEGDDHEHDDSN
jgi:hypothetical protein